MVRCIGDYTHEEKVERRDSEPHDPRQSKVTHNILLEYGEYDLEMIFANMLPPVFPTEVTKFWASLFDVAKALASIHNFKEPSGQDWHGYVLCLTGFTHGFLLTL